MDILEDFESRKREMLAKLEEFASKDGLKIDSVRVQQREQLAVWAALTEGKSDRETAIITADTLSSQLKMLFAAAYPLTVEGRLFDHDGFLETFANRIDAARAFELVRPPIASDLHMIRKIRNQFAHSSDAPMSFETSPIREYINSFQLWSEIEKELDIVETSDGAVPKSANVTEQRRKYIFTAVGLLKFLAEAIDENTRAFLLAKLWSRLTKAPIAQVRRWVYGQSMAEHREERPSDATPDGEENAT